MEIVFLAGRILRFCATKSPFFDALVAYFFTLYDENSAVRMVYVLLNLLFFPFW